MIELYSKEFLLWAIKECNKNLRGNSFDHDWYSGYYTGKKSTWTLVWDAQYGKSKARQRKSDRTLEQEVKA